MDYKRSSYLLFIVSVLVIRSASGKCENDEVGLADGYILDSQLTASSELNASTPAKNGRLNYTAGSSWCASTNDSNPYLQIDLQTLHIICAVSTQGNSQGDQWVETYTLQSSTDGSTWTDFVQDGRIRVFLANFDSKSTSKRILFSVITARYFRVVARDIHGGVCMRVELYGVPQFQGNIALFKPTSQSSTFRTYKSSRAVDGIKNTDISQCTHTDTSTTTNPWWRVDLRGVEPVAEVYILNRGDCCGTNLNGAEIRVGNSTSNGGADNHLCANQIQIPQGRPKYFSCKPKVNGRYVYIRIPGNNKYLTLCEVEVYSHYYMPNLALNRPASQISTAHGGVASHAVDGNPNNQWMGYSCTHTDLATNPWWRVDLGSSFPVAEVVIVSRQCTGPCADVLKAFEIRIGDSNQNGGATNTMCGETRSMNTGETKSFYCAPRPVGQYVSIRILGVQKIVSICEVQVYSTRRTIKACNNHPIGLEDSSKIPDNRFTASSSGSNKVPSLGRLNGGNAWLPATINKDDFLQIDLGSIYSVCSVATQGAPLADEWTKTYKIMTSLDNSNWTTYAEGNVDKIFNGNNDRSSIIRNDLFDSPSAKFIRLYPLTYHNRKALRVEVYGSSEGCQSSLGIEDSQLYASSTSDGNHAANYSRLYSSSSWCSASASTSEYLQVDLGQTKTLTGVATQGDPTSDEWVTRYMVQFGDSNTRWFRQLSFQGNERRDKTFVNWFSEPIETRLVRIVPLAWENSVCLRFELYGCGVLLKEPAKIRVTGPQVLTLLRNEKNLTVECFGRGKPRPTITWKKNGTEISKNSREIESGVVQVIGNSSDAWNVSSVLYLRIGGVTYNDAGNYTCEVFNGVDNRDSTIRVLFKPEFVEQPKHVAIVLQGNNVTLPCDVTGVPKPSIIWLFSGAKRPPSTQEEDGSLRVYSVRNNQSYEGLYTCKATSIAGILISNVTLTVDGKLYLGKKLQNILIKNFYLNSSPYDFIQRFNFRLPPPCTAQLSAPEESTAKVQCTFNGHTVLKS